MVRNAAYSLSAIGAPALSSLVEALPHDSEQTRGAAAFALGELRTAATDAVPDLVKLVNDESIWVRRNVVEALGTIGQANEQIVPALAQAVTDDADDQVRFTAGLSLARIGPDAAEAVPATICPPVPKTRARRRPWEAHRET